MRAAAVGAAGVSLGGSGTATATPVTDPVTEEGDCSIADLVDAYEDYSRVSESGPYGVSEQTVVELSSESDGRVIQLAYVRPTGDNVGETPVILKASPYFRDFNEIDIRACYGSARLVDNYVQHGYAVAILTVRGTGGSGGCFDLFGVAERRDIDQAVTWLGTREWSNENIGMIGLSYDGTTPWEIAATGNDYLETIVPISGLTDVYSLMYKRGSPEWRSVLVTDLYYGVYSNNPFFTPLEQYGDRGSCPGEYAQGTFAGFYSAITGERDPGGYWAERNLRPQIRANYDGSILLVQGLQDWNVDPSHSLSWVPTLEEDHRIKYVMGQWGHDYPGTPPGGNRARDNWADVLLRWFDYYLKEDRSVDLGPKVVVQDSQLEWRTASDWPPADAATTTFYLTPDETLAPDPSEETSEQVVAVDPTRIQAYGATYPPTPDAYPCETCAAFRTGTFDEEFRFAGVSRLDLTVVPTGPGGHLTAWLYAVGESSRQRLAWGQTDLRFADGGESAEQVTPGEPIDLSILLEPADAVVPSGTQLELLLHQGTSSDRIASPTPAPIRVQTGGDAQLTTQGFGAGAGKWRAEPFEVTGNRTDDGTVFTPAQTNQVTLRVCPSAPVTVRDTIPASWSVVGGDPRTVRTSGDIKEVIFKKRVKSDRQMSFTYFAEAPDSPGSYEFGPIEVSPPDKDGYFPVQGTVETNFVAGPDTSG